MSNQSLVCYWHHRMLHEGGWQVVHDDDGQLVVLRPPPRFGPIRQNAVETPGWRIASVPDLGLRLVRAP